MRLAKGLTAMLLIISWLGSCMDERAAEPASVLEDVYPNPNADRVLRDVYGPGELRPQLGPDRLYGGGRLLEED
ncbi:hypothetical protein [Paenibacillus daejeonensis]|uniref:hypothetical protein n=1 Tax=Paenibacillus daejeonensis TaxID=135193 RepID=UPI000377A6CC|nr:hypothetical protein [Paenibacillus daejeonensis]